MFAYGFFSFFEELVQFTWQQRSHILWQTANIFSLAVPSTWHFSGNDDDSCTGTLNQHRHSENHVCFLLALNNRLLEHENPYDAMAQQQERAAFTQASPQPNQLTRDNVPMR